jgi:hypothetical protein
MATLRTAFLVTAIAAGMAAPAGDAASVGVVGPEAASAHRAAWTEIKWPFPIDQWGTGRAFRCGPADCGLEINVYLRPKIGFCNCIMGVSDDAELDRVGDLELFSQDFRGLANGQPISVGWMNGRSRAYNVLIPYAQPRDVLAIAFNDQCDVMVATILAERDQLPAAERLAIDFLNGQRVLRWAKAELGAGS